MNKLNTYILIFECLFILACKPAKQQQVEVKKVLAIVEKGISSIGFYTNTGKHIKSLKLDTFPHEMRFSADRKYAYITNNGSLRYKDAVEGGNTISVVNLHKMLKEKDLLLDPFRRPHAIDIDPVTGYLAVGVEEPDQVLLIDPIKNKILKIFDNGGDTPHMVTISKGGGWIYVSNINSANLVLINTKTEEHFTIDVGYKPQESEISPDGSLLYVGCDAYIAVIDLKLRKEIRRIPCGANRLELIQDGKLLVFSSSRNGIGFANAITGEMIYHLDIPYKPYSIHVSEDESLAYVSAEEQSVVYVADIATMKIVRKFYLGDGIRPDPVKDFTLEKPLTIDAEGVRADLPNYDRRVLDTAFFKGYQVKSADINGDKMPDIVAVSDRLPEVVWYENPGWKKQVVSTNTIRNIDLAPNDIDGDGDVDLALASSFDSKTSTSGGLVHWLENPGSSFDHEWTLHFIDSLPTSHRLRWVDINGDGTRVLINLPLLGLGATTPEGSETPLRMIAYQVPANPKLDNWSASVIDSSLHLAHGISITRWDDDLREDILTASREGITLHQFDGELWKRSNLVTESGFLGVSEIAVGSLENGSGRFLATIEPWHGNEVVVYKKKGDQWKRSVLDTTFLDGHALACFDLNYDGYDEIIAGHRGKGYNLYIYRYQPQLERWDREDLDRGGMSAAGIEIFDANLDGIPDIVSCGSLTENVVIYLGNAL